MPDVLVVLGNKFRISAAQASLDGASARWTGGWTSPWPEGVTPAQNPKAAGEWLKAQWAAAGLTAKSVWVVMSREDIVLRHLELPSAPDEELPDLVRFQAAARSSVPVEQLCLDFLPLPAVSSRPGRDVLAASVTASVVDAFRATLKAADRDLAGVTFSSPALAEWTLKHARRREAEAGRAEVTRSGPQALLASLTRRSLDGTHADVTVLLDGQRLELALVADRQLVFGHAARVPVVEAETLVSVQAEFSRALVAAERLRPNLRLQHIWLIGGNKALAKALQEQSNCTVELIETPPKTDLGDCPAALKATPTDAVTLTGAVLARVTGSAPNVDFLRPRQPPPKRDPRKQKIAIGAAAALFGAFVICGGMVWRLKSMDAQIAQLLETQSGLDDRIRLGKPVVDAAGIVGDWDARNFPQLKQLVDLEGTLPGGAQRPYLSNLDFKPATGEALATLHMVGAAKTREDVEAFKQVLADRSGHRVPPRPDTVSRDDAYPAGFTVDVTFMPAKPELPKATATKTK
jgi:hypothetical protein